MQMAHIYEALLIVESNTKSATLRAAVERCDAKTHASFDKVVAFLATEAVTGRCSY
jgi:hypothetical protein